MAICNDTYKIIAYPYNILREFTVNNKVKVTSYLEAVRKLHAWRTYLDKILKRSASIAYELYTPLDPGISSAFSRDDAP